VSTVFIEYEDRICETITKLHILQRNKITLNLKSSAEVVNQELLWIFIAKAD
jgi:hypothetical protein